MKKHIETNEAPKAIGSYSQAIQMGETVYLSGQIPLDPETMTLVEGGIEAQVTRVFENLKAVANASKSDLDHIVKLTVYLTDINHVALVNEVMKKYFKEPFPARTSFAVLALPKNALVEVDAILVLS
jgi:reactive intermediate/imine deaminase